ncbi:hypothetical protein [Gandjariella thermophila]|uniref:hypothetical protein n=1 Tax=Gandjariella thermophila TaxID=1931992 RepID=UPI0010F9EDD7|nr:hypothetical protein [Gandjariella thermophila]
MAVEADNIQRDRHGWTVVVIGQASHIPDVAEICGPKGMALRSWAPDGRHCVVRIQIERVSGRRIPAGSATDDGMPRESLAGL